MNDLVAIGADDFFHTYADVADGEISGLFQPIPGGQSAFEAGEAFAEGNWAEGLYDTMSTGIDLASAIADPLGTLASSVASFLMDYMPPLPQALDELAGNPALVEGIGQTWNNISTELDGQSHTLMSELGRLQGSWHGTASASYSAACLSLVESLSNTAAACRGMGVGFGIASGIVEAVRGFVKQLIADLVGRLISYAAEMGVTLGLATPVVVTQATTAIAKTTSDVVHFNRTLVNAIRGGTKEVEALKEALLRLKSFVDLAKGGIEQGAGAVEDQ